MLHCGKERKTRYCPECGVELTGLQGLLDYCERFASQAERRAKHRENKNVLWRQWADQLRELMQKNER